MKRKKQHMSMDTFYQAMWWVEYFLVGGTQGELSLTGIGEGTLHPNFIEMMSIARDQSKDMDIVFSTNGMKTFTEEIAEACEKYNIGVFISVHKPEFAGKAIALAKKYGVLRDTNISAATSSFDWAGQVDWPITAPKAICEYLRSGWGVVLSDGSITTCCLDAEGHGIIGHVNEPAREIDMLPYSLCENCHMKIPYGV